MRIALWMRLVNVSRNCWWEFNDSSLSIYHLFLGPLICYFAIMVQSKKKIKQVLLRKGRIIHSYHA